MFLKTTKPTIQYRIKNEGASTRKTCAEYLNNELVLVCEINPAISLRKTFLSIHNPRTQKILKERELKGGYSLLSGFDDTFFLLIPKYYGKNIEIICKESLNTLKTIPYDKDKIYTMVDRQLMALSSKTDKDGDTQWAITLHHGMDQDFSEITTVLLNLSLPKEPKVTSITQLANGYILVEAGLELFWLSKTIKNSTVQFTEKGRVSLKPTEKYVKLPSGDILTYSPNNETPAQIWNKNQITSGPFHFQFSTGMSVPSIINIIPLIDGVNLILDIIHTNIDANQTRSVKRSNLLYHLETNTITSIDSFYTPINKFFVFPNGLIFISWLGDYILADFDESQAYRRDFFKTAIKKHFLLTQLLLNQEDIPIELKTNTIQLLLKVILKELSAFLPLLKEPPSLLKEKEKSQCPLMSLQV